MHHVPSRCSVRLKNTIIGLLIGQTGLNVILISPITMNGMADSYLQNKTENMIMMGFASIILVENVKQVSMALYSMLIISLYTH